MGQYFQGLLPTIPLVFLLVAVVIGFDCVWRVEKRLDTFMKLLTIGTIFLAANKIIEALGADKAFGWGLFMQIMDIISAALLMFAFIEMYRIIRSLNNEKPPLSRQ